MQKIKKAFEKFIPDKKSQQTILKGTSSTRERAPTKILQI